MAQKTWDKSKKDRMRILHDQREKVRIENGKKKHGNVNPKSITGKTVAGYSPAKIELRNAAHALKPACEQHGFFTDIGNGKRVCGDCSEAAKKKEKNRGRS